MYIATKCREIGGMSVLPKTTHIYLMLINYTIKT